MRGVSDSDQQLLDSLSPEQNAQLEGYVEALLEANAQFNLTAVRNREEAWERHIIESLRLAPCLGSPETLLDVGSGGGLPGMVLAIARPGIRVTLLEATGKKARFLEDTAARLKLTNVSVICQRAEEAGAFGSPHREKFELVTARAVAALPTLLELTAPFVIPGKGLFLVKGDRADQELNDAKRALQVLKVQLDKKERIASGTLLYLTKSEPTPPKYPRRNGEPKRKPL